MPQLIPDEIETLRMLAGQIPRRRGSKHVLCIEELASFGLCASVEPHLLTENGILCLDAHTGTVDLISLRIA